MSPFAKLLVPLFLYLLKYCEEMPIQVLTTTIYGYLLNCFCFYYSKGYDDFGDMMCELLFYILIHVL